MDLKMRNRLVLIIFVFILVVGIVVFSSMQEHAPALDNSVESTGSNTVIDEKTESNTAMAGLMGNNKADFTAKQSVIMVTEKEDMLYREGYFKVLQNEIPITNVAGEELYYRDLWRAGIDITELWENKSEKDFPYEIYYKDLDGDQKPELAINQGCFYIFKYDLEEKVCRILYSQQSCYFGGILGEGQLWYHDGLHANVIRDRYIVFDGKSEWETVLDIEEGLGQGSEYPDYFRVGTVGADLVMVDEDTWKRVTEPFFEMTENLMEPQSYEEIFGKIHEGHSKNLIGKENYLMEIKCDAFITRNYT